MAKSEYIRRPGETVKDAKNRYRREWVASHPERVKFYHWRYWLKSQYGLTIENYNELITEQGGKCKICGCVLAISTALQSNSPVVDHKGSVVRGILCNHCNQALGLFKDSTDFLKSAILYLTKER